MYGWAMSTMRKTAAATDNAQANSNPMTVAFVGARRPKVTKSSPSQKTRTARNAHGRPSPTVSVNSHVSLCYVSAYL